VDSTLYTTSAMLRTIELLLGLPPMSQFDAAATPMYASFTDKPDLKPYQCIAPKTMSTKEPANRLGRARILGDGFQRGGPRADASPERNHLEKRARPDSQMPVPVHRFWFAGRR
jgi:hypothetical protein